MAVTLLKKKIIFFILNITSLFVDNDTYNHWYDESDIYCIRFYKLIIGHSKNINQNDVFVKHLY